MGLRETFGLVNFRAIEYKRDDKKANKFALRSILKDLKKGDVTVPKEVHRQMNELVQKVNIWSPKAYHLHISQILKDQILLFQKYYILFNINFTYFDGHQINLIKNIQQ